MLITTPAGTNANAIQLVVDLAELLGAAPLFSDPIEADGLLSMTDLFPRIVTSLYLQTTLNQPGWVEAGKVAGPAFWHMTKPAEHFIAGKFVAHEILLQKDNVLRYLNLLQDEVQSLQDSIESGDEESIAKMLQQTVDEQARWMTNRISGRWEKASPDFQKAPASGWKKLLGMEAPDKKRKA
jgi:prephenate dehydrogenase